MFKKGQTVEIVDGFPGELSDEAKPEIKVGDRVKVVEVSDNPGVHPTEKRPIPPKDDNGLVVPDQDNATKKKEDEARQRMYEVGQYEVGGSCGSLRKHFMRRNGRQGEETMRSFLLSKKTSFAALLLALAVSVADNFGYTHAVSRIPGQLGLGSDGSDGYISYANLITTRNHYETVKASYEAQESKLKGVELLDKADELRIAQREFNAAKTAFLTEFVKRSSTAKIDPLNVRIGLQFAVNGKLLPVEDSKENHRPIVQPMDDDNVTALVKR